MNNLKIALLHYSSAPVVGGVEKIVHEQCSLCRQHFHPVKIFSGNGNKGMDECDVEFNPLLSSSNDRILKLHKDPQGKREELHLIIDEIYDYLSNALYHYDVLIAHNVLTMPYNLPLTYALHKMANSACIKLVSWNHDSPYFYEGFPKKMLEKPWDILKKYNPNIHYITISESRKRQFSSLYGNNAKIKVIPNGIDPSQFFRLDPTIKQLIQDKNLMEADLLMGQPCRLHPRKNIELSIRVVKALQEKGIHARLLCTGAFDPHEGNSLSYFFRLKRLAQQLRVEGDVFFIAEFFLKNGMKLKMDDIDIRDLYLISDLLFMPSISEGFGVPLLEAGINKLPIFCSDIPPFQEIGSEYANYFSLSESSAEVADKILNYFSSFQPYGMYRYIRSQYYWDNIYNNKLLPFLQELTA